MRTLAQDSSPAIPEALFSQLLGPVGALALSLLVLVIVWRAFSTGTLRTGKQVDDQLEQLAKDHDTQVVELRRERDWWRNLAMEALGVGERLATRRWGGAPSDD